MKRRIIWMSVAVVVMLAALLFVRSAAVRADGPAPGDAPAAVPLPPAAIPGAVMMIGMAVYLRRARREP